MGLLEDVMKTLERIPMWKRVSALPDEIEVLKERITALEAKLAPATGDACPKCRELRFRLISTRPMPNFAWAGKNLDTWKCDACGYSVEKAQSG